MRSTAGATLRSAAFRIYQRSLSSSPSPEVAGSCRTKRDLQRGLLSDRGQVPLPIWKKAASQLHVRERHPLNTIRHEIQNHLEKSHPSLFLIENTLSPIVTTKQCFDDLLVPADHVSRAPSDTYYIDRETVLRTHMTAHDVDLMRAGCEAFLLCGDVYRRDTVDRTHYPVFHQIDSARLYPPGTDREAIISDLQGMLIRLARHLFGYDADLRWVDAYFPFTEPSFELEVRWKGEWLELLGCGLLRRGVLSQGGIRDDVDGWAFGLGLERLAMVLFDIPDIRLFWSQDERFLDQFRQASLSDRYRTFSVYPGVEKDISFWIDEEEGFHENDLHELVRGVGGDLVESVRCIDEYKGERKSLCFRIVFRSMERNLTNAEINKMFQVVRADVSKSLPVTLR